MSDPAPVHVLTGDLFFRAKIEATAAAAGARVAFARDEEELSAGLDGDIGAPDGPEGPEGPDAGRRTVLIDLADSAIDPAAVIRSLKGRAPPPTVIAFGSHREHEVLKAARAAGADRVLARSAFVERLSEILQEAAGG